MAIQPTVYTPTPLVTTTTAASTYRLTRPLSPSSPSSSPRWRRCAMWLADGGKWAFRRRYELAPAAVTSGLTGIGLAQTGVGTALVYGALAAGSAAGAFGGLKHKMQPVAYVGAAGTVAFGEIACAVGFGMSWPTVTAWLLSTGAAYGAYVPWLTAQRNQRMKLHVDTLKARGALPDAMGMEAAHPGLTGDSPEETALRRALFALTKHVPLAVDGFHHTRDGWSCAVKMPAGTNTSPTAIMRRRTQLQANLGLPGTLSLNVGADPNDLLVKLSTVDQLAGTLPFEDTGVRTCTVPVLLGRDDEGREFCLDLLYRHTLIAGATNWGKSGLLNLIIARLAKCEDAELYGIDMKPGAPELGPWSGVMKVAQTAVQAEEMLDWIGREIERRGGILEALSRKAMAEGNGPVRKWTAEHGKFLFVFGDELAELVRQAPKAAKKYESLLALARFVGIQFISATQQPSKSVFGGSTDARGNYANRLSTRVGEPVHGPFIFGQGSQTKGWRPEFLDLPGKFLAMTPDHNDPRRIYRAQHVTDQDIADAMQFHYSDARDTDEQPAITDEPWVEQFAPLRFPDGTDVGDAWPELYREFQRLGQATKKELATAGQVSRDTVMRALEHWTQHGVTAEGRRPTVYRLPTVDLTKDA